MIDFPLANLTANRPLWEGAREWTYAGKTKQAVRRPSGVPRQPHVPRKRYVVKGISAEGEITGSEKKMAKMFTRKWLTTATKETVVDIAKSRFNVDVTCDEIPTYAQHYKCFLIKGLCENPEIFYTAVKWPKNVEVSRYFERRIPSNQSEMPVGGQNS